MELNFLYNDGNHLKKISFNAAEVTDQTFLMSQVGGFSDGNKNVGWCPKLNNLNFRTTEPRYFGTTGYGSNLIGPGYTGDYSRFFPDSLVSAIKKYPAANTYTLTTSSNFLGTKPSGSQYYSGVPLLREVDGAYKKVCNLLWAYREQPIPGQSIHSYIKTGFWNFSYPSDEFPDSSMYFVTADRNEHQFTTEFPEIKMSLWIIKVQDDVTGSVSYGQEFKLLAQVINGYVSFIDLRLLNGADEEGQPITNGSNPKMNSTPTGWGGARNVKSSSDEITGANWSINISVNRGAHGTFLYNVDIENLSEFVNCLWSDSLMDKFRDYVYSPSSGVLACHALPYDIVTDSELHTIQLCGTEAKYSNNHYEIQPTLVPGLNPTYTYAYGEWAEGSQTISQQYGKHYFDDEHWAIYIEPFFGSFLDFEPYTKIQVRLPFIGTVPIPTSSCMDGYLTVNYVADNRTGNVIGQIYSCSKRNFENGESTGWVLVGQWTGNCAVPIPLVGNSMGSGDVVGAIKGFASNAAGTILDDSQTSLATNAIRAGLDMVTARHEPRIIGTLNANAGVLGDCTCRVIISRPVDVTPGTYKVVDGQRVFESNGLLEQKGIASYSGGTVGQYEGVTQGYVLGNIDGATEGEMLKIRSLFADGVNIKRR